MDLKKLKEKILKGHLIKKEEAVELVNYHDKQELYDTANEIRQILHGNTIELCSITNAKSGNCSQDCKWCSQSWKHNTGINTYDKIDKNEALKQAKYNSSKGVNRMSLVISGRSVTIKDLDWLLELFNDIEQNTDLKMCASMGLLTKDQLQLLKSMG